MARPHKHSGSSGGTVHSSWVSKESIGAGHQAQSSLWKKESHPPSWSPSFMAAPTVSVRPRAEHTMNYLCALEACLTGNVGTLQKGCKQWDSAANYLWLSVSNSVTSARGEGGLPCEEKGLLNKQTRLWQHIESGELGQQVQVLQAKMPVRTKAEVARPGNRPGGQGFPER